MTRLEAIEILRGLKPTNTVSITDAYNTGKALTMAIASLETDEAYQLEYEEPEFCKDCVSRKEVIKLVLDRLGNYYIVQAINKLPSVYPKSEIKVEDMGRYDPYTDKFIKE